MMKKLVVLMTFLVFAIGSNVAQELGVSLNTMPLDTGFFFSQTPFTVTIENKGFAPFNGSVTTYFAVVEDSNILLRDSVTTQLILQPQMTFGATFNGIFIPDNLRLGGNTVVVWPVAPGTPTADSLTFPLWMLDPFDSQLDSLGIEQNFNGIPQSVLANATDTLTVNIENRSRSFFEGDLTVFLGIENDNQVVVKADSVVIPTAFIKPFESMEVELPEDFDLNVYNTGGNTVVVWPMAPQSTTEDSLWATISVDFIDGISELPNRDLDMRLVAYPNPSTDRIYLQLDGQKIVAEEVRIYNVRHQLIQTKTLTGELDLNRYDKGIYFLEVLLPDMKYKTFKVIKR